MNNSERITEMLTLKALDISIDDSNLFFQGAVPKNSDLEILLKKAGAKPKQESLKVYATDKKGKAQPEFIYTFNESDIILVVECKRSIKNHVSENIDQPSMFAVDGVLYYAKYLKEKYNVIALAVSGTSLDNLKVSSYEWKKNHDSPQEYSKGRDAILEKQNYLNLYHGKQVSRRFSLDEIRSTALLMHNTLREVKITERTKPIFIAGILIALNDLGFEESYLKISQFDTLMDLLISSIKSVLKETDIQKDKVANIIQAFETLKTNTKLKEKNVYEIGSLHWYIEQLDNKIKPMMIHAENTLDALGVFYHEFIKYSGGDGQGLGIVLTPQHLTEFMVDLVDIGKNDRVVDICCGSGSFLITAMTKMFKQATNFNEFEEIKKHGLYGIDFDPELYTLAIANMIIRKDGKSNIHYGDCFNPDIVKKIKSVKPTVGLINPPYSQKDTPELQFVDHLLNILDTGGKAAVVVPMSCAIGTKYKEWRQKLFKNHTLKAVFSMPDDIFYPHGTNVCVMLWEAHKPHNPMIPTYFGYNKDDGFIKRKKLGRVDSGSWSHIKDKWLTNYRDKKVIDGESAYRGVTHQDEWLAEAYMKTDWSTLKQDDFEKSIRAFLAYKIESGRYKDDESN
jgi:type I restriction-modification system DNA methylase subunit